jgi:hypothetical protein
MIIAATDERVFVGRRDGEDSPPRLRVYSPDTLGGLRVDDVEDESIVGGGRPPGEKKEPAARLASDVGRRRLNWVC